MILGVPGRNPLPMARKLIETRCMAVSSNDDILMPGLQKVFYCFPIPNSQSTRESQQTNQKSGLVMENPGQGSIWDGAGRRRGADIPASLLIDNGFISEFCLKEVRPNI